MKPLATPVDGPARLLAFPIEKARPGLRHLLEEVRARVSEAEACDLWAKGGESVGAAHLAGLIPADLHAVGDGEITALAIRVSVLGLHAVHEGAWKDATAIPLLTALQVAGQGIAARRAG